MISKLGVVLFVGGAGHVVLAVWLITKGFNPSTIDADSARQK